MCLSVKRFSSLSRNYVVEKRDRKTGDWVRCTDPINGTEVTLSKLKEGHEYEFRVMAENCNGLSEPLATDKPILIKNPFSNCSFIIVEDFHGVSSS